MLTLTIAVQVHLGDQVYEVLLSGFLLLYGVLDLGEHLGPFSDLATAED